MRKLGWSLGKGMMKMKGMSIRAGWLFWNGEKPMDSFGSVCLGLFLGRCICFEFDSGFLQRLIWSNGGCLNPMLWNETAC